MGAGHRLGGCYERRRIDHREPIGHAPAPVHLRARAADRGRVAGPLGRTRRVRDAEPGRTAGRSRSGRRTGREAVRPGHVPVPVRCRPARRPPARLHRHRRVLPLQADDRPQRALHDGVRRVRPARRAVRRADRHPSGRHDRCEHRQHAAPAATPRAEPRHPAIDLHDRSAVLPLDPVDLQPDLQRVVRRRAGEGPPDRRADRRVRVGVPSHRRRPSLVGARRRGARCGRRRPPPRLRQ